MDDIVARMTTINIGDDNVPNILNNTITEYNHDPIIAFELIRIKVSNYIDRKCFEIIYTKHSNLSKLYNKVIFYSDISKRILHDTKKMALESTIRCCENDFDSVYFETSDNFATVSIKNNKSHNEIGLLHTSCTYVIGI